MFHKTKIKREIHMKKVLSIVLALIMAATLAVVLTGCGGGGIVGLWADGDGGYFEFNADGTGAEFNTRINVTHDFTWETEEGLLMIFWDGEHVPEIGVYTVSRNTLSMREPGEDYGQELTRVRSRSEATTNADDDADEEEEIAELLAGRWENALDAFEFRADGTGIYDDFFDEHALTWSVEGNRMTMTLGGETEEISFSVTETQLVLGDLGTFERAVYSEEVHPLIGIWEGDGATLEIRANGAMELHVERHGVTLAFSWVAENGTLTRITSSGLSTEMEYSISGNQLTISEGGSNFDGTFERAD